MNEHGGYIRFVGGSRHNRHIDIHTWIHRVQVQTLSKKPLSLRPHHGATETPHWESEFYELTRWITEFGTEFLEYTIAGTDPATFTDDPYFWPPTHHRQPLPPSPKVQIP